jgi:hypothetical protein
MLFNYQQCFSVNKQEQGFQEEKDKPSEEG